MSKLTYELSNMFKSHEQREIEARIEFQRKKRDFQKYSKDLKTTIQEFEMMAINAEKSGNSKNALVCVAFIRKLQKTESAIEGIILRFRMIESTRRLSGIMENFARACRRMGYDLDANLNLKTAMKNTVELEKALAKMEAMSEQMGMIFDSIDASDMGDFGEQTSEVEVTEDDRALLDKLMHRDSLENNPTASQPTRQPIIQTKEPTPESVEDEDEKLRKLIEGVKG